MTSAVADSAAPLQATDPQQQLEGYAYLEDDSSYQRNWHPLGNSMEYFAQNANPEGTPFFQPTALPTSGPGNDILSSDAPHFKQLFNQMESARLNIETAPCFLCGGKDHSLLKCSKAPQDAIIVALRRGIYFLALQRLGEVARDVGYFIDDLEVDLLTHPRAPQYIEGKAKSKSLPPLRVTHILHSMWAVTCARPQDMLLQLPDGRFLSPSHLLGEVGIQAKSVVYVHFLPTLVATLCCESCTEVNRCRNDLQVLAVQPIKRWHAQMLDRLKEFNATVRCICAQMVPPILPPYPGTRRSRATYALPHQTLSDLQQLRQQRRYHDINEWGKTQLRRLKSRFLAELGPNRPLWVTAAYEMLNRIIARPLPVFATTHDVDPSTEHVRHDFDEFPSPSSVGYDATSHLTSELSSLLATPMKGDPLPYAATPDRRRSVSSHTATPIPEDHDSDTGNYTRAQLQQLVHAVYSPFTPKKPVDESHDDVQSSAPSETTPYPPIRITAFDRFGRFTGRLGDIEDLRSVQGIPFGEEDVTSLLPGIRRVRAGNRGHRRSSNPNQGNQRQRQQRAIADQHEDPNHDSSTDEYLSD